MANAPDPTVALIARALAHLLPAGQVTELRAPAAKGKGDFTATVSGYFDSVPKLAESSRTIDAPGVYLVLNPVDTRLLARCNNRVKKLGKGDASTTDSDILCRRWLFVEIDPVRPSGICATDVEKVEAKAIADVVRAYLRGESWPEPMVIDSGNGTYLLYRVDLPTDDAGLSARCLKALSAKFDTPAAHIDTTVANPSRIARLPGSWNRKGDRTPDRPHRKCVPLSVPDELQVVSVELLESLASTGTVAAKKSATAGHSGEFAHRLLVPEYLSDFGIESLGTRHGSDGQTRWLVTCPFNPAHTGTDAYVVQYPNGAVGFHCSHNSCSGNQWDEFKERVGRPRGNHFDPSMTTDERGDESSQEGRCTFFNPDGGVPVSVASLSHLADIFGQGVDVDAASPTDGDGNAGQGSENEADEPKMSEKSTDEQIRRQRNKTAAFIMNALTSRVCLRYTLFRSTEGLAYASQDGVTCTPVEGERFNDELYRLYRELFEERAQSHTISNAVKALAAQARLSRTFSVFQRSGLHDGRVFFYRNDPDAPKEVIVIDDAGWRTVTESPVRFLAGPDIGTVPPIAPTGNIEALRPFLNIEDPGQFPLLCAWVAGAVVGGFPQYILGVTGGPGSAKTTFSRIILRLIDPSPGDADKAKLRGAPKEEDDVAVAALHSHLLVYDNLSGFDKDMADLFCRISTGGVFTRRTKHKDKNETVIELRRPVILTGIDLPNSRGDFLERTLAVPLRKVEDGGRKLERRLYRQFEAARPEILAGLFTLVSNGLKPRPDLENLQLPRMADFTQFAAAAVGREVVDRLLGNETENAVVALEECKFLTYLLDLMSQRSEWRVSCTELLKQLNDKFKDDKGQNAKPHETWPKWHNVLSSHLKRYGSDIMKVYGLEVTFPKRTESERGVLLKWVDGMRERYWETIVSTAGGDRQEDRHRDRQGDRQEAKERNKTLLEDLSIL